MYGTYPVLNRPFSVSAHTLLMEVNMFAENMGHDTVDSIHLPATVLCLDPQAYPTARQILLYRALGWTPPSWAHAPLIVDTDGKRLAKRTAGLSIRELRQKGKTPEEILTAPLSRLLDRVRLG